MRAALTLPVRLTQTPRGTENSAPCGSGLPSSLKSDPEAGAVWVLLCRHTCPPAHRPCWAPAARGPSTAGPRSAGCAQWERGSVGHCGAGAGTAYGSRGPSPLSRTGLFCVGEGPGCHPEGRGLGLRTIRLEVDRTRDSQAFLQNLCCPLFPFQSNAAVNDVTF